MYGLFKAPAVFDLSNKIPFGQMSVLTFGIKITFGNPLSTFVGVSPFCPSVQSFPYLTVEVGQDLFRADSSVIVGESSDNGVEMVYNRLTRCIQVFLKPSSDFLNFVENFLFFWLNNGFAIILPDIET